MSTSNGTNLYQKLFQESGFIEKRTHENRQLGNIIMFPRNPEVVIFGYTV